jgi:hypothetical protein
MTLLPVFKVLTACLSFRGKKYIELPYVVKGMDVSFSGILSYIEVGCLHFFYRTYKLKFLINSEVRVVMTFTSILKFTKAGKITVWWI